jgi:hypothetical protein
MAGAVIVLDRRGGILQMTPPAEAPLGEHDGLLICKGSKGSSHTTLCAHMCEDSARLTTRIRQALAVACGELQDLDGTLQIRRPSGRCALLVQVTPLPASAFSPWGEIDGGARVMIQINDPQASIDAQAERLRLLVGRRAPTSSVLRISRSL